MDTQGKTKVMYEGQMVEAIDATPTWEAIAPILIETATTQSSRIELMSMARTADKYNKLVKAMEEQDAGTVESFEKLIAIIRNPSKLNRARNEQLISEVEQLIKEYHVEQLIKEYHAIPRD